MGCSGRKLDSEGLTPIAPSPRGPSLPLRPLLCKSSPHRRYTSLLEQDPTTFLLLQPLALSSGPRSLCQCNKHTPPCSALFLGVCCLLGSAN